MKKANLVLLACAVLVPASALAQQNTKPQDVNQPGTRIQQGLLKKEVTMSGRVSDDGKAIVNHDDDVWDVSNPKVLTGHEGQEVTVKCQIDLDKNEIRVLSVKTAQGEVKYVAYRGDSAFRR